MRFFEFETLLTEAKTPTKMTAAQIGGGNPPGKYLDAIADGIANGTEFNFYLNKEILPGVIQDKSVAKLIHTSDNPSKLPIKVKTADGEIFDTTISSMVKDEISKGELQINMGNVAEAVLGSAMTALFAKDGATVTVNDIMQIGKSIATNGSYETVTPSRDNLEFNITIPRADTIAFNAFVLEGAQGLKDLEISDDKIATMEQHFRDAVQFVNTSPRAKAALNKADDPGENKIEVLSDGGNSEKQKTTKVDLEIFYDGTKVNLISLKAGSVKQFGQESGAEFSTLERFFKSVIGFGLPSKMESLFKPKTDEEYRIYNYEQAFPQAYKHIYNELKSHVAGDNTRDEYSLVKQVYDGIRYHATRNEEGVTLVVLSPNKKKAFQELGFGKELMDALEQYDIDVSLKEGVTNPTIEIYGVAKTAEAKELNKKSLLIQMRSFKQKNAIRNVIEMGDLLKNLADLEKIDKAIAAKSRPKATVEPQKLDADPDADGSPNWADQADDNASKI